MMTEGVLDDVLDDVLTAACDWYHARQAFLSAYGQAPDGVLRAKAASIWAESHGKLARAVEAYLGLESDGGTAGPVDFDGGRSPGG